MGYVPVLSEYGLCSSVVRVWVMFQFCHIVIYQQIIDQNRSVCWSIVKEKPNVRSPFFLAFTSDQIPQATKDVDVASQ
jgi:hypothetical protein